jgi:archaellum component FlaG (FlaF/FlaG flagellin family)
MNSENSALTRRAISIVGIILIVTIILANTNSIYGLLTAVTSIGSSGVVSSANIGVYQESQCINTVSSINWGTINPGGTATYTVYVKNTGTVTLTLSFTTSGWSPSGASAYFTLTWSYTGSQINPNAVVPITFTLSLSQSVTGVTNFQFQITITGTQV